MLKSIFWKPYSGILIVGDNSGWSTDVDAQDLKSFANKVGIKAEIVKRAYLNVPQAVHYTSQFSLLLDIYKSRHRLSLDYYHGKPDQGKNFKKCFETLKAHQDQIARVRVSNREMAKLLKTAINPEKVMLIHLGIDLDVFKPQTAESKKLVREELDIREDAFVIGSFIKDGDGWGEGLEPKFIKGPDIFLKVVENLKDKIPNLWVLLSGPARGYVKQGLEKLGVNYRHKFLKDYREISKFYDALDLYIVTSREEGGPKAVLESMAKGIPLVTTDVGQAKDLVTNKENAMMTAIDNVSGLSASVLEIVRDSDLRENLIKNGFKTSAENSFEKQLPLWKIYLEKLVN